MGLANKIAYKFATIMYTTFEQSKDLIKTKHIGAVTKVMDCKKSFENTDLTSIKEAFDPNLKTLLFIGGSAGAKVFNDFITQTPELEEKYNVINISGDSSLNRLKKNLYRVDYVTDLYQPLMNLADVVVTRGGSNTLGREASRGDQLENAAYFEEKGYALQLPESELNINTLEKQINLLISNSESYEKNMSQSSEIKSQDEFYQLLIDDMAKVTKG